MRVDFGGKVAIQNDPLRWNTLAKRRWPRSTVIGKGQFAVLTCAYFHPSARRMQYSDAHLFETQETAEQFQKTIYCHAATKSLCTGKHEIFDLANWR